MLASPGCVSIATEGLGVRRRWAERLDLHQGRVRAPSGLRLCCNISMLAHSGRLARRSDNKLLTQNSGARPPGRSVSVSVSADASVSAPASPSLASTAKAAESTAARQLSQRARARARSSTSAREPERAKVTQSQPRRRERTRRERGENAAAISRFDASASIIGSSFVACCHGNQRIHSQMNKEDI